MGTEGVKTRQANKNVYLYLGLAIQSHQEQNLMVRKPAREHDICG